MRSNVPQHKYLYYGNRMYHQGHNVRVLLKNKSEYIGIIIEIGFESFTLFCDKYAPKEIMFEDVEKFRIAESNETFDTVPHFDAEEKEFWRTHWYTKDGIKEKTPEDIKMLEEFFAKYK